MNSRLPSNNQPPLNPSQSSYLFSPPNSPGVGISPDNSMNSSSSNNGNSSYQKSRTESFDLQNMDPKDKLEKLKDITSKTIDTIIFKINDMKREKQFLQSFKDIMKISESLVEIERSLDSINIKDINIGASSSSSSSSTSTSSTNPPSINNSNNSNNNNNSNVVNISGKDTISSIDTNTSDLIKIIHSKSNFSKKGAKIQERSTNSIDSIYQIIHKCLDNIKNMLLVVKKQLIFEDSVPEALKVGQTIRNIRNQINIFRTISLPENLQLADSEKILLKVENCNYHIYHEQPSDSNTSNSNSNGHNHASDGKSNDSRDTVDDFINGILFLTNYQIIFIGQNSKNECFIKYFSLHSINKLHKYGKKKKSVGEFMYRLNFICKDYRNHIISFDKSNNGLKDVRKCIDYHFSQNNQFCYSYRTEYSKIENVNLGWNIYNQREELARMGIPCQEWRISDVNTNYFLCDSYPSLLIVPDSISDDHLKQVSQFRSKGRIPSLTYRHWSNKCTITRCSQPLVGIGRNRCEEDESLLNAIRLTSAATGSSGSLSTATSQPKEKILYIIDARPYASAFGNRAKGAGFELIGNYPGCVIEFLGIPNIHSMRHSLLKFKEVCSSSIQDEDHWYSNIESSGWMEYTKLLLQASTRVVKIIHMQHSNVLIHCSDGWDRTSQMCSLAEILLDPFYRTIRGFQILIEKDWLSFGYKFAQRHGQINGKDEDERSPIFYQFFEALYQLLLQFPGKFEYNSHFLRVILYHSYSGKYGNFLFNTEKDRIQSNIQGKTISLWVEMEENIKDYLNPLYVPTLGKDKEVLIPDCSIKNMRVWKQLHINSTPDSDFYDPQEKIIRQLMDRALDDRSDQLKLANPLKSNRARTTSMSLSSSGGAIRRLNHSSSQMNLPTSSFSLNNNAIPMNVLDLDNNLIYDQKSNNTIPSSSSSSSSSKDKDKHEKSLKDGKSSVGKSFFRRKESSKQLH
ncbi:myotubularin-related protein [Tieghemostelium lacteum]|uniref:Myotubularin-related protein n=1 Tax=Tieghemostelium lacteum TaxID=361077 RepID=A0A151ZAY6_TIELA|nr:myotubularin-related protein [Tieghemostelium lacteum]|eukprot:KYQ91113.1 myotubularin-related protein [Tieghemostelium lacteum]